MAVQNKTIGFKKPMKATLVKGFPSSSDWLYEKKFDGYRTIAVISKRKAILYSISGINVSNNYIKVMEECAKIGNAVVLDGELIALKAGKEHFSSLQLFKSETGAKLEYCVFDLLHLDGHDLTKLPLVQRKELLQSILKPLKSRVVKYVVHKSDGPALFEEAKEKNWEGIIGKRNDSIYFPGRRTPDWIKIKTTKRQEVVIIGYTVPEGSRKFFGSLLLGYYEKTKLVFAGKVGTGFSDKTLKDVFEKMQLLKAVKSPFSEKLNIATKASDITWIKPKLVAEIKFMEWTPDGKMRHTSFQGLRTDKNPLDIIREIPAG